MKDYWLEHTIAGIALFKKSSFKNSLIRIGSYDYYTATGGDDSKNHKSIWISFSLYSKIRVNNNSHRFVIIKPQDIFGLSKNTLPSKFCPICFVFVGFVMAWFLFLFNYVIKNHATFYINKRVTNFHELFQDFWGLIITNLYELLFTPGINTNQLCPVLIFYDDEEVARLLYKFLRNCNLGRRVFPTKSTFPSLNQLISWDFSTILKA